MENNRKKLFVDIFFDTDKKYNSLIDVPDEIRIFNSQKGKVNSIRFEATNELILNRFINHLKKQHNILFNVGQELF